MTITILNSGIGGSTGAYLATASPLYSTGAVWYVDSTKGTDAVSPAGLNREKPLATLSQAVSNAASGDIISLGASHSELQSGTLSISKALLIVGEGSASGVPTATLIANTSTSFALATAGAEFHNIRFAVRTAASATARVTMATGTALRGCYFDCAANETGPAVTLASSGTNMTLESCTFTSTATLTTAQPESAVKTLGTATDVLITDCVFSDGTVGFSNSYSCDLSAGAITRLEIRRLSLLLGAELKQHASSTWRLAGLTTTRGGRIVF
jgi:hypothetical protein